MEVVSCQSQARVEVIHDRADRLAGKETACVSEDLKCWGSWDTICGHKAMGNVLTGLGARGPSRAHSYHVELKQWSHSKRKSLRKLTQLGWIILVIFFVVIIWYSGRRCSISSNKMAFFTRFKAYWYICICMLTSNEHCLWLSAFAVGCYVCKGHTKKVYKTNPLCWLAV